MPYWIFVVFFATPCIFVGCAKLSFHSKGVPDPFPGALIGCAASSSSVWFRIYLATAIFVTGLTSSSGKDPIALFVLYCLAFDLVILVALGVSLRLLPKCNPRDLRKGNYHRGYSVVGVMLFLIAFVHGMTSFGLLVNAPVVWENPDDAFTMIAIGGAVGAGVSLFYVFEMALHLFRVGKFGSEVNRSLSLLEENVAPIIFLRSFEIDKKTVLGRTVDEAVCSAAVRAGIPVVSLCDPNEFLPTGGSLKIQAKDETWKEVVKELLGKCRAVVMCEGVTEGLRWEVQSFKAFVRPEQFFIISPPFSYRMRTWFRCSTAMIPLHCIAQRKSIRQIFSFVWTKFRFFLSTESIDVNAAVPQPKTVIDFSTGWKEKTRTLWRGGKELFRFVLSKTDTHKPSSEHSMCIADAIKRLELHDALNRRTYLRIRTATIVALAMIAIWTITGMVLAIVV